MILLQKQEEQTVKDLMMQHQLLHSVSAVEFSTFHISS